MFTAAITFPAYQCTGQLNHLGLAHCHLDNHKNASTSIMIITCMNMLCKYDDKMKDSSCDVAETLDLDWAECL